MRPKLRATKVSGCHLIPVNRRHGLPNDTRLVHVSRYRRTTGAKRLPEHTWTPWDLLGPFAAMMACTVLRGRRSNTPPLPGKPLRYWP